MSEQDLSPQGEAAKPSRFAPVLAWFARLGEPQADAPEQRIDAAAMRSARGPLLLGYGTLAVLVFGFGLWASLSSIAGAVVASGQVEVEQNRQVVQHPDGGVVAEIVAKNGDQVAAGDLLLRLDGELLTSEFAIVEGQYFEILARSGRLEAERADAEELRFSAELLASAKTNADHAALIEGQSRLFAARKETLRKSLEQLEQRSEQTRSQITGVEAQLKALGAQLGLIEEELADQRQLLKKGLAQSSRVLALEREAASLAGQVGELEASRAQAQGQLSEIDLERLRLGSERRETAETELRDLGYQSLELAERRRALAGQIERLDIRAPVAGLVHAMAVTTPRSVIRAAEPVLYLVPQDRPLVVTARISPINIDEVHVGQAVNLRLSAFAARTTPEVAGHVTRLSADALVDEATRASYFEAEVMIDEGEQSKLDGLTLLPGMPAEVFIRTGERSPLAYLLKPFTDYFNRAFREE